MDSTYQTLLDRDSRPVPPVLRDRSPRDLGTAPIDAARYTSRAFLDAEDSAMWGRVWQMACREEDIPEAGDVEIYDIVDRSALIVRTASGAIRAYHNSCLHRGRKLMTRRGRVETIRCGFHGWSWNLEGGLNSLPCRAEFDHLDDGELGLVPVRAETWGGFVFVCFDEDAPPLAEYLGVLPDHFARWKPEDCYKAAHVARVIACNWKVAQEAFMESYHVIATHPQILPIFQDVGAQYDVYGDTVNRNLAAFGVASPHMGAEPSPRAVVDGMLDLWGRSRDAVPAEREIDEARSVLGDVARRALGRGVAGRLGEATDAEMLDALVYNVFPNFAPWGGFAPNIVYRWRPNGRDPDSCIMEVMILKRLPADGRRPAAAPVHWLGNDEAWSAAPELPVLGPVIDQDMENMPLVQLGLKASPTGRVHLARHVESRIRHFHRTLDRYLASDTAGEGDDRAR